MARPPDGPRDRRSVTNTDAHSARTKAARSGSHTQGHRDASGQQSQGRHSNGAKRERGRGTLGWSPQGFAGGRAPTAPQPPPPPSNLLPAPGFAHDTRQATGPSSPARRTAANYLGRRGGWAPLPQWHAGAAATPGPRPAPPRPPRCGPGRTLLTWPPPDPRTQAAPARDAGRSVRCAVMWWAVWCAVVRCQVCGVWCVVQGVPSTPTRGAGEHSHAPPVQQRPLPGTRSTPPAPETAAGTRGATAQRTPARCPPLRRPRAPAALEQGATGMWAAPWAHWAATAGHWGLQTTSAGAG
jgi:hypothetical protein